MERVQFILLRGEQWSGVKSGTGWNGLGHSSSGRFARRIGSILLSLELRISSDQLVPRCDLRTIGTTLEATYDAGSEVEPFKRKSYN